MLNKILAKLGLSKKDTFGNLPPIPFVSDESVQYDFMKRVKEKDYPFYLSEIYKQHMNGADLDLANPKKLSEKIQWLKLYDNSELKTKCTDKIKVRDYVKEKIGEQYLKPVLCICNRFEDINFDNLPNRFFINCNHGRKFYSVVKDKQSLLNNPKLFNMLKENINNKLGLNYAFFAGFEMQYNDIIPRIIVEELLKDDNENFIEIQVFCFNGKPLITQRLIKNTFPIKCSVYNENLQPTDIKFSQAYLYISQNPEDILKDAVSLSSTLAQEFKFVRISWILYKGQLYFNSMSFSPYSGFLKFEDERQNIDLGKKLELKQ